MKVFFHWFIRPFLTSKITKLTMLLFLVCAVQLTATGASPADVTQQARKITGTVTEQNGDPIVGASISVKGDKTSGTISNLEGEFSLQVQPNATIVISYLGFNTQEIPTGNQMNFKVVLEEDTKALEEVIVIGYGTSSRKEFTGSVGSVKLENSPLANLPNSNLLESLKGRVSGMNVGASVTAGSDPSMLIRGQNSINGDNNPLIVLDGVIFMGNLTDINPNDISTIDVLKDAVSAAAYGSRSANGIIAITTRKGKTGKPVISVNATAGIQTWVVGGKPHLATGPEWLEFGNRAAGNPVGSTVGMEPAIAELVEAGIWHDRQDEMTRTGQVQDYQVSVSGATNQVNYYLSTSYEKNQGLFYGDDFNRISVLGKIDTHITNWLTLGVDAAFSNRDYSGYAVDYGGMQMGSPYYVDYREIDPLTYTRGGATYPLWGINDGRRENTDMRYNYRLNAYVVVDIPWIKGLSYKINYQPSVDTRKETNFAYERNFETSVPGPWTPDKLQGLLSRANGNILNERWYDWVLDNTITYKNKFGKHSVEATAVATRDLKEYDRSNITGSDFLENGNTTLGVNGLHKAAIQKVDLNGAWKRTNIGYLLRGRYGFDDKYYITASTRRDGASVFGANKKWGNFNAVGGMWRISEENFMKGIEPLNDLKIKLQYGQNGNQLKEPYSVLAKVGNGISAGEMYEFGDTGEKLYYGIVQSNMGNANMGWEKTSSIETGFETAWLNNRINVDFQYYHSKTTDQIFQRIIPSMTGFRNIFASMGQVNNSGVNLTVETTNIKTKDWTWTTFATFWKNNSKVIHLYGEDLDGDGKEDDDIASGLFIGKSLGSIYGYEQNGIVQEDDTEYIALTGTQPGNPKYNDMVDGIPGLTTDDRKILGYKPENFRLNFGTTVRYKDFEFYALAVGIFGGNNHYMQSNPLAFRRYELGRMILNDVPKRPFWTPENRNNTYPQIQFQSDGRFQGLQARTFVRIQDISLSYNLANQPWVKALNIQGLKIFAVAKNVALFTNWWGVDPETGQDWIVGPQDYPVSATYSLGLNLSF
jgi:TonB-linked SusC/RagA family outer membrane protein